MKKILSIVVLLQQLNLFAQAPIAMTERTPVNVNGLEAGYSILSEEVKEVGDKGNFSRFQVQFYITNTSNEAKILLHRQGFTLFGNGNAAPSIAQFNCINATGARLTAKQVLLQAKPCIVQGFVEDRDPSNNNKTIQNRRPVNIGYWIRPGETINNKSIVIVPLNEKPTVSVTFFPENNNMVGSVINSHDNYDNNYNNNNFDRNNNDRNDNDRNNNYNNNNNNNNSTPFNSTDFLKIRNFSTSAYLNVQNGPLDCSAIHNDWWSAQWQIQPVNGTNYYVIKNRWKNTFISTESSNSMISGNDKSINSMWTLEAVGNTNTYRIKNAANSNCLMMKNGSLQSVPVFGDQDNAKWIIEQ